MTDAIPIAVTPGETLGQWVQRLGFADRPLQSVTIAQQVADGEPDSGWAVTMMTGVTLALTVDPPS